MSEEERRTEEAVEEERSPEAMILPPFPQTPPTEEAEVRLVTAVDALTLYAALVERSLRVAEMQLEDWKKELDFVIEELKRLGIEWQK